MDLGADLFNRMHLVPRVQAVQEKRTNRPTNAKSHVPTRRDTARHNVTNASPSPPAAAPCVTPRRSVSDASFGKVMCSLCNTPHWRTTPGDRCSKCVLRPERVTTCGICLDSCLVFNDYCSWTGTRHHTGGCNGRNVCTSCMVQHCSVELKRSDGMTCRCPHPECAATLTNDELRLVSNGLAERVELVQTRIKRAKELTDKQAKLNELADRLAEREGLLERVGELGRRSDLSALLGRRRALGRLPPHDVQVRRRLLLCMRRRLAVRQGGVRSAWGEAAARRPRPGARAACAAPLRLPDGWRLWR